MIWGYPYFRKPPYQVDSFFHSFMTQLVTQRRQKSRVGTSPSTSSTRSRASTYRWDQGAGVQSFLRCLDRTHFWWTNSNTEYIFGGTSTLNIISDLVLHSCIRSVALHYAVLCPFLGCRSFIFKRVTAMNPTQISTRPACILFFEMTY